MTQEELAERSGLSAQAISTLERGTRRVPRPSTVEWLAAALGLDPSRRQALVAAARGVAETPARQPPVRPPEPRAGIPPDPTPHFAGRETELAAIDAHLAGGGRAAVHGLGGIGKTQLVVRYIQERRDRYPAGVFWLRADLESSLVADLASLAWRLELPEREAPEQERQIEAALRWLRAHDRWLLVLDNAEPATAEAATRWLPGLSGSLLLTSRTPMWHPRLGLGPLDAEVAGRFLLTRAGEAGAGAAAAAENVARSLGGLPLALEQAAAYLEVSGRDLAGYAGLLRTRVVELMREGKPEEYPRPLATTWQLSFQRIESERPSAAALLRLCALLAPDDIPISVLEAGARELPEELRGFLADGIELDRTIAALRRYSMTERQGDGLRVHRLVQAVVRESMRTDGQLGHWLAAAVGLLASAFPADVEDPAGWPLCARLLPHAQATIGVADGAEPERATRLMDRVAGYLRARGEYALARPLLERALMIRERQLGPRHPDTAASLDGLGVVLWLQGELAAARPHLERALAVRERLLGPDHPDTGDSLNNLALLLWSRGELAAARPLYERALAIFERTLGPDHLNVAHTLNNMALVLWSQGDLAAAGPLYERAVAICERVHGPDHPETAQAVHNLANVLRDEGRLAAARPLYERALDVRERILGPDHPDVAQSVNSLALLLQAQGEPAAAGPLYDRALAIRERVLGADHPDTAQSLGNVAGLLRDRGERAAARSLLERALAIRERVLGPDHPDTATTLDELGLALRDQGEQAAAREMLERALAIRERVLGPDHLDTAASLDHLALLLRDQEEPRAASALLERARAIHRRTGRGWSHSVRALR
jgi:tetratricopeptide (TPR) repeat protein